MATDTGAALVQALRDGSKAASVAADATETLLGAGGPSAVALQAALQAALQPMQAQLTAVQAALQPMQTQLTAVQAALQPMQTQLTAMQVEVRRNGTLAAKSYNAGCGSGDVRPYAPVPNGAGETAPVGTAPLASLAALRAVSSQELSTWCVHYGIAPVPRSDAARRAALAVQLGLHVPAEALA
jgi:hypothetical protein